MLGGIGTDSDFPGGKLPSTQPTTPDARAIRATASPLIDGLVPHVTLAQFLHLLHTLLQPPLIDSLDIEAPVAADLEAGQLSLLQQAVNGGTMHAEIFRELAYGKNLGITQHLELIPLLDSVTLPNVRRSYHKLLKITKPIINISQQARKVFKFQGLISFTPADGCACRS
jgi:hypothetical protein